MFAPPKPTLPVISSVPPTVAESAIAKLPLESNVIMSVPFGYCIFFTPILLVIFYPICLTITFVDLEPSPSPAYTNGLVPDT